MAEREGDGVVGRAVVIVPGHTGSSRRRTTRKDGSQTAPEAAKVADVDVADQPEKGRSR